MNDTFHGNSDALMAYLYDECDPAERDAIAAHVAQCLSCADEVASLRATRRVLATWTPPETSLGFQITRAEDRPAATVLRPAAWWRQPLPAWAQAAAAVLIFGAGLAVGNGSVPEATSVAMAPAASAPAVVRMAAEVTREDVARLEQRLLSVERSQGRTIPTASAPVVNEEALLAQVHDILSASEDRQRREMATVQNNLATLADYMRRSDLQRRVDMRQFEDQLGRIQGATGIELQQQREALINVVRTSLSGGR